MDTSETYIKMCEQADILQQNSDHYPEDGDFFAHPQRVIEPIVFIDDYWDREHFPIQHMVWLPRQDQLQAMLRGKGECAGFDVCVRFHNWSKKNIYPDKYRYSMEQLWLAFAMKEKFNKVWKDRWHETT